MTMTHCLTSLLQQDNSHQTMRPPGREAIHSGQFMVSDFEAEAKEDDDVGIQMPDPDDSGETDKLMAEKSSCTALQIYRPRNVAVLNSNQIHIDTSLAKLMKCISLSYKQKLTSPKWNHFKGIRLMWKDKIRLNNLIWRCWHMQFIMKVKTVVCQFASPLDVDIHNKPEAVILEGKYWKRQLDVIKAEYMKWRKYNRSRIQCASDSIADYSYLSWSPVPLFDSCYMLSEECDNFSDTLFSSLSEAYYFPDTREINRSTNADYIQPSLEALQPNLEENSFQDIITKLAPVPEEIDYAIDDRPGEYQYPAIMGSEQMDTSTIGGSISDGTMPQQQIPQTMANSMHSNTNNVMRTNMPYSDKMFTQTINSQADIARLMNDQSSMEMVVDSFCSDPNQSSISGGFDGMNQSSIGSSDSITSSGILKPGIFNKDQRNSRNQPRPFSRRGREMPNYISKVEPTIHQTNIYNQIIAQHQTPQVDMYNTGSFDGNNLVYNVNTSPNQQTNSFSNALNLTTDTDTAMQQMQNNYNMQNNHNMHEMQMNHMNMMTSSRMLPNNLMGLMNTTDQHQISNDLGSGGVGNMGQSLISSQDSFKALSSHQNSSHSYNPYPQQNFKFNNPGGGYQQNSNALRHHSPPGQVHMNDQLSVAMNQQLVSDKEKYRSHSLPLNTSLPMTINTMNQPQTTIHQSSINEENFAVPKYTLKGQKSRSRSHSVLTKQHSQPQLSSLNFGSVQPTTSEPMLSSSLASLLTNSKPNVELKQNDSSVAMMNYRLIQDQVNVFECQLQQHQQQQTQSIVDEVQPPSGKKMRSASGEHRLSPKFSSSLVASPDSCDSEMNTLPKRSSSSFSGVSSTRRTGHNQSEKNRRCNIKHGFDMLDTLIPQN